jgi:hypothetical protein
VLGALVSQYRCLSDNMKVWKQEDTTVFGDLHTNVNDIPRGVTLIISFAPYYQTGTRMEMC